MRSRPKRGPDGGARRAAPSPRPHSPLRGANRPSAIPLALRLSRVIPSRRSWACNQYRCSSWTAGPRRSRSRRGNGGTDRLTASPPDGSILASSNVTRRPIALWNGPCRPPLPPSPSERAVSSKCISKPSGAESKPAANRRSNKVVEGPRMASQNFDVGRPGVVPESIDDRVGPGRDAYRISVSDSFGRGEARELDDFRV